jgi:S1-C subfamily serine protease
MNKVTGDFVAMTVFVVLATTLSSTPESGRGDPMSAYVALRVIDSDGDTQSVGTGFAITPTRVATCFHMLETDHFIVYEQKDPESVLGSRVVFAAPGRDFAIIEFSKPCFKPVKLTFGDATVGDKLHAVCNIFGMGPMYWEGYVSKVDDRYTFFFPAIPNGGSGSAIYNEAGQFVGVAKGLITNESNHQSVGIMIPTAVIKDAIVQAHTEVLALSAK